MADLSARNAEHSTEANQDVKYNATQLLAIEEIEGNISPDDLALISESTVATLHVVNNKLEEEPLSARVHIKTPNPTVDQTNKSLITPYHICCVIDISGSMSMSACSRDENGNAVEDIGLSILDIVKFATLVVVESLNPQDKLTIVTYSNDAETVLPPTKMTLDGKAKAKAVVADIKALLRTNLFDGLKLGVQHAHNVGDGYIHSVFLLTDGFPTMHPEEGYDVCIPKVLSDNPFPGSLSTFGFGSHLDDKLLVDIAKMGGGYFSFIPDAGMVGTCFINALANAKCVFGVNPVLKISGCDFKMLSKSGIIPTSSARRNKSTKPSLRKLVIKYMSKRANKAGERVAGLTLDECLESRLRDDVIYITLTPLRYGCDVDVMLKPALFQNNRDSIKIEIAFETVGGTRNNLDVIPSDSNAADELFHSSRALFVKKGFNVPFHPFDEGVSCTFINDAKDSTKDNSNLDALYQDMKGEATEAIASEDNFRRWGQHFLLSLSTAHLHQFCNNFKDPGVQVYGTGKLFSSLQDSLDDIFEQVPPAVPSRTWVMKKEGGDLEMSKVFNNRNTTCVHGKTLVIVRTPLSQEPDNCNDEVNYFSTPSSSTSCVPVCSIKKGDLVLTADGTYAKVECVIESIVDDETSQPPFDLIKVGHLCVTPYHPVKVDQLSGWQFPIQVANSKWMVPNDDNYIAAYSVYNLVLENGQRHKPVLMDGVETITLGHGITNDAILQHAYFGTDKIVSDLKALNDGVGWNAGHIVLKENNIKRDSISGCISLISEIKDINEGGGIIVDKIPWMRCVT